MERPPKRGGQFFTSYENPRDLLGEVSRRILHITYCVMSSAFRLIELAFRLQFLIAGHLTSGVLNCAFGFIGRTLDVFAIHDLLHLRGRVDNT